MNFTLTGYNIATTNQQIQYFFIITEVIRLWQIFQIHLPRRLKNKAY